jgi:hypothetical protein
METDEGDSNPERYGIIKDFIGFRFFAVGNKTNSGASDQSSGINRFDKTKGIKSNEKNEKSMCSVLPPLQEGGQTDGQNQRSHSGTQTDEVSLKQR